MKADPPTPSSLPELSLEEAFDLLPPSASRFLLLQYAITPPSLQQSLFDEVRVLQQEQVDAEADRAAEALQAEAEIAEQQHKLLHQLRYQSAVSQASNWATRACKGVTASALFSDKWEDEERALVEDAITGTEALNALLKVDRAVEKANGTKEEDVPRLDVAEILEHALRVVRNKSSDSISLEQDLANSFEGRFVADVRWEHVWEGVLFEWNQDDCYLKVPLDRTPPNRLRQTLSSFHPLTPRSSSLLASLPIEILRTIFHIGGQSLLPPETATLHERPILHRRRSRYLSNASLVCPPWRTEAQSELGSFAYCSSRLSLDPLIRFLEKSKRAKQVRRFGIDVVEKEDPRLWVSMVDVGGKLDMTGIMLHLNASYTSLQISNHSLATPFDLGSTVTSVSLFNLVIPFDIFSLPSGSECLFRQSTTFRHLTVLRGSVITPPQPGLRRTFFPFVTSLLLDTNPLAPASSRRSSPPSNGSNSSARARRPSAGSPPEAKRRGRRSADWSSPTSSRCRVSRSFACPGQSRGRRRVCE